MPSSLTTVSVALLASLGVIVCRLPAQTLSDALDNDFSAADQDVYIVVLEIKGSSIPQRTASAQVALPAVVSYQAKVLSECKNRHVGEQIELRGTIGAQGKPPSDYLPLPIFKTGSTVLLAARATDRAKQLESLGTGVLPIGTTYPVCVPPADVDALRSALRQYCLWDSGDEQDRQGRDSVEDLLASSNYYEWALGATHTAVRGEANERANLLRVFGEPSTPLRRVLWVNYLAGDVFPADDRPHTAQLHRYLTEYLTMQSEAGPAEKCRGHRE